MAAASLHGFGNDTDCDVLSDEQVAWMRADVAAARDAGAKWIVLTMHKGVFTAGAHLFDAEILRLRDSSSRSSTSSTSTW